jgi:RNA polymerase sigma-70 factor (ECF subfamily)
MLDDKEIILRCQSGRMDVIEILIDRYKNPLYKFCCHLTNSRQEGDDLFQETWVKVMKNINLCDSTKPFETWLCTITVNLYKDKYRRSKRWLNRIKDYFTNETKEIEMTGVESREPLPEEQLINRELKDNLKACINKLDDIFKIPLVLFYYKEMSYQEISDILDIPAGTVKSRLNSGRNKLKEMMEVKNYG